jgi:hypothetical protein
MRGGMSQERNQSPQIARTAIASAAKALNAERIVSSEDTVAPRRFLLRSTWC